MKYRNILIALAVLLCMTFGTAWADDTQERTIRIGFTIQKKQEKSICIGFKVIHNYTISYDLDGGTNNENNPTSYTIESPDITLQPATKTGYTFAGWTGTSLDAATESVTITQGSTGNRSYRAEWTINQYTLSFDTAGGTTINAITQDYSSDITAPANPTKTGYTFASWSPDIPAKMPAENQTFTATWTANTYTVAFNANNGTGTMSNQSFTYDETAKALTTNTFTRSGYTFNGWNTQTNGTGTSYTDGQSVQNLTSTANATITLYAQWTIQNYTITYDLDGGTVATANPSSYKVESNAITLNNPTRTGYTFAGWTGSNGTTPQTTITIAKGSTGNRNYKANWTINQYTLTFDTAGGTTIDPITQDYSSDVTAPANPTRTGYTFAGWDKEIPAKLSTENLTLIATWTPINYIISYDLDGGTVTGNPTSYTIESADITLNNPTKISHDFTGWTGTDLIEATMTVTIAAGSTGNRSYKAKYTKIEEQEPEASPDVTPEPTPTPAPETPTIIANGVETTPQTIVNMDTEEIEETFGGGTPLTLAGNMTVKELNEVIEKVTSVTTVTTLDLSKVEGVDEVKIDDSSANIETITLTGNQSIKTVEVTGNTAIKTLNVTGSKVETVDAKGCESLEEVNVEGCEELVSLDVSETSITSLNAKDCKNLNALNCSSCDISDLNLDGCEALNNLDCSNNSLARLNANSFKNLSQLECRNQHIHGWRRSLTMSIIDLFRGLLFASAVDDESDDESDVANVDNLKAYDPSDNEISVDYDKETGEVKFSALPETFTYDYITGFDNIKMDVTVSAADDKTNHNDSYKLGSHGGGCNSGFGLLMLLTLLSFTKHGTKMKR